MEKITITRALSEIKLLDARIKKAIEKTLFVDVYQNRADKALTSNVTKAEYEKNVFASSRSIDDLIKRRQSIKDAILKSNAKTKVKVNGVDLLVVEAIERKSSIEYKQLLLAKIKKDYTLQLNQVINAKANIESQIEKMLTQNLGADKKASKDDWDNIAKPFLDANELKLLDPISIKEKHDELEKEIEGFLSEVDFTLSESNSRTEIEI